MTSKLSVSGAAVELALELAPEGRRKSVCATACRLVVHENGLEANPDIRDGLTIIQLDRIASAELIGRLDRFAESFEREYWEKRNAWEQHGEGRFNTCEAVGRKFAVRSVAWAARGLSLDNICESLSATLCATADDDKLSELLKSQLCNSPSR